MTIEEALEVYEPKTYITSKGDNILKIIDNLYDSRDSIYYYVLDALNSNVSEIDCLRFVAVTAGTISLTQEGTWLGSWPIQYSENGIIWKDYVLGTTINLAVGNVVYFRGQKDGTAQTTSNYRKFVMTGSIAASGDCTSLLNGIGGVDDLTLYGEYTFFRLFRYCSIISVPSLPATTLANQCYHSMFAGCNSLTSVPSDFLPATTLAILCYGSMFYGCTYLTTPPSLPAQTLGVNCYNSMFYGCTSLTSAPFLPAITLVSDCYRNMFYGCSSLTSAPSLPATTLANYCYYQMFLSCISLTSAPSLPATTLKAECYRAMFYGCNKLTGPVNISATSPYYSGTTTACSNMFFNSGTSTGAGGTIYVGGNVSLWNSENCGIDSTYWTVQQQTETSSLEMSVLSDSIEVDSPEVEVLSDSQEVVFGVSQQGVFTLNSDSSFIVDDWYPEGGFPAGKSILYFPKEICALIYEVTG